MGKYLDKIKQLQKADESKAFVAICGTRLAGKSSLAGTIPGTTLMLHGGVMESGSESAKLMSTKNKNNLVVIEFNDIASIKEHIKELANDEEIDNVYVDGISVLSELKMDELEMKAAVKKDVWGAFRMLGDELKFILIELKKLTTKAGAKKPKNVFITTALKVKYDSQGNVTDVDLDVKGNVAVDFITKICPNVVTIVTRLNEKGEKIRRLLTKKIDHFPARIGSMLDEDVPIDIDANLKTFLELIKKGV